MAVLTYRFQYRAPGTDIGQIESEVGTVVSVSDEAGGVIVDIDCDELYANELFDSMADKGFAFISGSPTDPASEDFASDIDGDKLHIDYNPANYTPDSSIPEADDIDDLAAHLKGISDQLGLTAGDLLGRAIFKIDGGLVYDSDGHPTIKEVQ